MWSRTINLDDVLTALYRRLNRDAEFGSMVTAIDKGLKRVAGYRNPTATVHVLTAPVDAELHVVRSTAIVNVYMDDHATGQADTHGLGARAARVQYLLHRSHLPTHPEGPLTHERLRFETVYVQEPLILRSDVDGEHFASVRVGMIISRSDT